MHKEHWLRKGGIAATMARQATDSETRLIQYELAGRYSIKAWASDSTRDPSPDLAKQRPAGSGPGVDDPTRSYGLVAIARWEEEGGALEALPGSFPGSADYYHERERHCRDCAQAARRAEVKSTYLGFAARYAALAKWVETGQIDVGVRLTSVGREP